MQSNQDYNLTGEKCRFGEISGEIIYYVSGQNGYVCWMDESGEERKTPLNTTEIKTGGVWEMLDGVIEDIESF